MKNEIVKKEKYTRYKLAYIRGGGGKVEGKIQRTNKGKAIFLYDYGDKLRLRYLKFNCIGDGKYQNKFEDYIIRRDKKGIIVFYWNGEKVRNCSSSNNLFLHFQNFNYGNKKRAFSAAGLNRFVKVFNKFAMRNKIGKLKQIKLFIPTLKKAKLECEISTNREISTNKLGELLGFDMEVNTPLPDKTISSESAYYDYDFDQPLKDSFLKLCYPALNEINISKVNLATSYSRYLREPTLKLAIAKCFGYKGDKLFKMVCEEITENKELSVLGWGALLRGLIPVDYFYQILKIVPKGCRNNGIQTTGTKVKAIRNLLKHYNAERILKLVDAQNYYDGLSALEDTAKQYNEFPTKIILPAKPKNATELHDDVSKQYRQIEHPDFEIIPKNKKLEELQGKKFEDYKIVIPKTRDELIGYGNQMSNCVGSYAGNMRDGHCIILGVIKGGEMKYNIEIRSKQVVQFKGPRNAEADPADKEKVLKFLKDSEVIFGDDYKEVSNY